ncbi:FYB1 protein, partial [Todus mexicanus]|nr:FYB1 protein [Todus mexicanus]
KVQQNEPNPRFSKPPLAKKLSINPEVSHNEATSSKNVLLQKGPSGPRPNTHSFKAAKEMDESSMSATEAAGSHFSNTALKPIGCQFRSLQGNTKNVKEKTDEKETSTAKNTFLKNTSQEESNSTSSKSCKMNTVLAAGRLSGGPQEKEVEDS